MATSTATKRIVSLIQALLLIISIVTMSVPSAAFAEDVSSTVVAPIEEVTPAVPPLPEEPATDLTPVTENIVTPPTEIPNDVSEPVDDAVEINPQNVINPKSEIPPVEEVKSCTVVSDETTEVLSAAATATWVHPAWTTTLTSFGAKWLWKSYLVDTSLVPDTTTFTKHIVLTGTPTSATLEIAADNTYTVLVNGVAPSCDGSQLDNFSTTDTCAITLQSGDNKLIFTVTNTDGSSDPQGNPAGLQYKVSIEGSSCEAPKAPPANTATIYAMKIVCSDPSDLPRWGGGGHPIIWSTASNFLATHPGCHTQGDWGFEWADQNGGYDGDSFIGHAPGYTPFPKLTNNNGKATAVVPLAGITEIHLREVLKPGYIPFSSTASTSAEFYCANDALNYDNWDFIRNPVAGGKYWCIAFNSPTPEVVPPDTDTSSTIVVRAVDLETADAPTAVATDSSKWFFYNDTTDVIDNVLGSFVNGPATAPIGSGSAQITLDSSALPRVNIATFGFSGTTLSSIKKLSYDSYSHSGVSGPDESPYLVMNVSFDGTDSWQRRLVYVPASNGPVPQDVWNTNDTIAGGAGKWVYSGASWPGTSEAGTITKTWSQILTDYPNAKILPTGGLVGIRVGEPGPALYTGNVDKFVIGIKTGTNTQTTTYDFEPTTEVIDETPPVVPPTSGGGGGSRRSSGGSVLGVSTIEPVGQVLGASCTILINDYLRIGQSNDKSEVSKLQQFLNDHMQSGLPVTGFFGPMTDKAVRSFQLKHNTDVLAPWVPLKFMPTDTTTTGYVYKTTQWKINMIHCPELNLPFPQLP